MDVHPLAAEGFARAADAYERARPTYPPHALDWVVRRLGIAPGRSVLDLAAGTGKLTRLLVPTGARVIAVEPVAAMRERLAAAVPAAEVLEGTAEALPLLDASVDAVTVGQAFHWFRGGEAVAEIARVLRPRGALALLWNVRDEADGVSRAISELVAPYRGRAPAKRWERWREGLDDARFTPLEERVFPFVHELERDALPALVASVSYVASLAPDEREQLLARVRALAASQPEPVRLRYRTEVYACTRR